MASLSEVLDSLRSEPLSSADLQRIHGVSQATMSRLLRRAGSRVVRLGRGRSTRYAAAEPTFGRDEAAALFQVNDRGVVEEVARLQALASGEYLVQADALPRWLRGLSDAGLFESLPYFLYDLAPSGFLGRQVARRLSRAGDFPPDPRQWTDQHIGAFLMGHADDLPGNLVVGDAAARRANAIRHDRVVDREIEYPQLAVRALNDDAPGSSAAGEQPKFAVYVPDAGHVIVKFSPSGRSAEARRWRDLLRAEFHALTVLSETHVPTARTSLLAAGGRVFVESRRFDRVRRRGRRAAVSLFMVDAEFAGEAFGWSRVVTTLCESELVSQALVDRVIWAETFGAWIGNSDMHLGNLSLSPTATGFELHPVYDMLPMAFAPLRGELPSPELVPPVRTHDNAAAWTEAGEAALEFWRRLAGDKEVSREMRSIASGQQRRIAALLG